MAVEVHAAECLDVDRDPVVVLALAEMPHRRAVGHVEVLLDRGLETLAGCGKRRGRVGAELVRTLAERLCLAQELGREQVVLGRGPVDIRASRDQAGRVALAEQVVDRAADHRVVAVVAVLVGERRAGEPDPGDGAGAHDLRAGAGGDVEGEVEGAVRVLQQGQLVEQLARLAAVLVGDEADRRQSVVVGPRVVGQVRVERVLRGNVEGADEPQLVAAAVGGADYSGRGSGRPQGRRLAQADPGGAVVVLLQLDRTDLLGEPPGELAVRLLAVLLVRPGLVDLALLALLRGDGLGVALPVWPAGAEAAPVAIRAPVASAATATLKLRLKLIPCSCFTSVCGRQIVMIAC